MFLRVAPLMVQRELTSNQYLFSAVSSHCLLVINGPMYSAMYVPFLMSSVANRPSPVRERPMRNGCPFALPLALWAPLWEPFVLGDVFLDLRAGMCAESS